MGQKKPRPPEVTGAFPSRHRDPSLYALRIYDRKVKETTSRGRKTPRLSLLKISAPGRAAGGIGDLSPSATRRGAINRSEATLGPEGLTRPSLPSFPRYGAGGPYKRKKRHIFFVMFSICYERKSRGVFIESLSCVYFFLIFGMFFDTSIIF